VAARGTDASREKVKEPESPLELSGVLPIASSLLTF